MDKFRKFFGLKLGYLVFSITEQLSVTLQRKDTTVQEANKAALLSGRYLSQLRNEEEYGRFYEQIVQSSQGLTEGLYFDLFRQQYFQVLDIVTNEVSRRFDQQDLKTVVEMEKMLLSACDSKSDKDILIPQLVERIYEKDLQIMDKLMLQLKMIPELLGKHKELTGHTIKQVENFCVARFLHADMIR